VISYFYKSYLKLHSGLCRLKWKVTTLVMCLDCNQHSIEQWRHINVRCHIDVTQLCNDVTLMSHNCMTMYKTTFNRTMTSHKCTSSPIHIKEESDVTKNVRCHKFTFSGKLNIFIKISSIKKIMVPNKSTFKKKIKSHISLQEDNYVT
jgi:hypothetical protein